MPLFEPHTEKQDKALFGYIEQDYGLTICGTGIQWGKTIVGIYWLRLLMEYNNDRFANYIVTSPTFKILAQSTLPAFKKGFSDIGTLRSQDMNFPTSFGTVWFRTGTDPDSVVGMTDVKGILCDEAGLYSYYFWENIQGRAARLGAPIMIVTSPYSQNWLYKDYIRHLEKGGDAIEGEKILLIQARSDESPYFSKDQYEKKRRTMDPRRFKMMFGGQWGKMEGLVFDCFDDAENQCEEFPLPIGTQMYCGVDWGNRHAFVIHIRAIAPDGNHYQVGEFYRTGCNPMDMVGAAKALHVSWGIQTFFADPSQPGMIDLFCSNGIPCVAADNDIKIGIGYHYELIKSRKLKLFQGRCPYSLDQYSTYHYPSPKDLQPDQDEKEIKPVKVQDDAMDAARYCTMMVFHRGEARRPVRIADMSVSDINRLPMGRQIEMLKKPKRYARSVD